MKILLHRRPGHARSAVAAALMWAMAAPALATPPKDALPPPPFDAAAEAQDAASLPAARPVAEGAWVKAFPAAPIEPGARFEAPDYFGSALEDALRPALRALLAANGLSEGVRDEPGIIAFSIKVDAPKRTRDGGLPKSPLQIEGVDPDPTDTIADQELRPYFSIPVRRKSDPAAPTLTVTVYATRDGARLWSGYAGAPYEGGGAEPLARALLAALIPHVGDAADLEDIALPRP